MAYKKLARRLKFLTASYRRHGFGHVVEVFRQERARRRYARSPIGLPETGAFIRSFTWSPDPTAFVHEFMRSLRSRVPAAALTPALLASCGVAGEAVERAVDSARHIAAGRFEGLGLCIAEPSGSFDWSLDYGSGVRWPQVPFPAIRFMDGGSDVKYPWELSRMYWIGWLGTAWRASGDRTWPDAFARLVDDWSANNPVNIGVNWAMPMEVGIRTFWLLMGAALFCDAESIDARWWVEYLRLAWAHATHLEHNLEYFSNLTNHYVSNCFGMLAAGALFADSPQGARWLAEGRRRLIAELEHQVLADGVHYERSIGYHRLVAEMYVIATALLERAGVPFPADACARIEAMAEFIMHYMPPAGTAPQLGDSDDGVILRLDMNQALYDHRDTLALAATVFGRDDFARAAGGPALAACLLVPTAAAVTEPGAGSAKAQPGATSYGPRLYGAAGFAVLRNERLHVLADVGEIGLHGNNDTLSFTLSGTSGAFVVDPGTYCYTRSAARRNELRATAAHNTPAIDEAEIAEFDGLWRIERDSTAPAVRRWETEGRCVLEAEHHAYRALTSGPVTVRRLWELDGALLRVVDTFVADGTHSVAVRFTIPPEVMVERLDDHVVRLARGAERLIMKCSHALEVARGWYSPSYGVASPAAWVVARCALDGKGRTHGMEYIWRLSS